MYILQSVRIEARLLHIHPHTESLTRYCDRITGFDASAHLSEETNAASWNAPIGVLMSVGCSAVFGFFLLISLLFSIQNFQNTVESEVEQPVLQILIDVFGENGAIALMTLVIVCVWHCGLFSMTSNSRMMFGFSRDGGLPHFFNKVRTRANIANKHPVIILSGIGENVFL